MSTRFCQPCGLPRLRCLAKWIVLLALVWMGLSGAADAAGPRAFAEGQMPDDCRLQPPKDLDGYFPFEPPADLAAWKDRAEQVRRRMLVAFGLWPLPAKTPLNAVIHGRIEQEGYTIEKVYFESFPGFFVTGNLYRPASVSGRVPGVLCPHGHWSNGRFYDCGEAAVRRDIVQGAERFEDGGRSPLQSRCVELAKMGCVVFHYDMIGYADSQQISFEIAHRFAKQRPEMNRAEGWGLFSPQAESNLQSVMGLQTWNSIRSLDFLESLPDVDPARLAVTGASGGGTQTFAISAIDPRVAVSVPAVMVSTAMQGGCTCENACLLRIGTGNIEFAALFAPKPLALTAADDWTKEMETKGFPQLKQLYQMFGAADNVRLHPFIWFPHNYNYVSRAAMYDWVNRHFKLGLPTPIVEEDYQRLTPDVLTVWDNEHPKPQGGDQFERDLLRTWKADTDKQLAALRPKQQSDGARFREVVGGAVDVLIGRAVPAADAIQFETTGQTDRGGYAEITGRLRHVPANEELPVVLLAPKEATGKAAIWLSRHGKSGLFGESGEPLAAVQRLLTLGVNVIGVDLLYQGEFLSEGKSLDKTPRVENPRESAAYTFGYNHTVFAARVHDVLTAIAFAGQRASGAEHVYVIGLDGGGAWAAAAVAQAGDVIGRAAIDTDGFRFADVADIQSPDFLPGGAKYFDLPGMLALATTRLWLAGETSESASIVVEAYQANDRAQQLSIYTGPDQEAVKAAVGWLIGDTQ